MSTTIDSLDIQIRTSAGSASKNILELAASLELLKSQSGLTKITNSLSKLSKSLGEIGRVKFNSNSLDSIVRLMRNLSTVQNPSGFNSALNSLKKLPELVNALNGMRLNNGGSVNQITQMVNGLSGIQKLSGLNSVINTLKKLPGVMDSMDSTKIEEFVRQMERLAEGLGPLATRINEVARGFSRLPSQVSKAATAVTKLEQQTKKAAESNGKLGGSLNGLQINLAAGIANFQSIAGAIQNVIQVGAQFLAQAIEWDGIQYRFGRAFGEDAEEVYTYVQKVNDVLGINIQQFMQYSSLYGSLLSGFGLAQKQVTTISVGLTELSYDIWAAYNDRFKTLEDASEAVRSAITGEIEPIRNAGIALTEASLQEYLDSVGMATVSIEKLTEAQKAEVRYAAMVKAAMQQGIVGTYAAEMHTAEGAVRNLSQSLKTLTQAFGSLFIPILQKVIPYVTVFVELLTEAVHWIAGLFGVELFKIDWGSSAGGISSGLEDVAAGAGDATAGLDKTAKAAKKLQDYTMGFDELNVIQPPSNSAAGGGAGGAGAGGVGSGDSLGLDLDTLWDDSVFAKASQQVDEIKAKVKAFLDEWKTELAIIAGALAALGVANLIKSLGQAIGLGDKFLGTANKIKQLAATAIILTIQWSLMSEFLENFIKEGSWQDFLWAAITGALGAFASYLVMGKTGLVLSLAVSTVVLFKEAFADGDVDSIEEVVTALTGVGTGIATIGVGWKAAQPAITGIKEWIAAVKQNAPEVGNFAAMFPKLSSSLASFGTTVSTKFAGVAGGFTKAFTALKTFLGLGTGATMATVAAVIAAIAAVVVFLARNWDEVTAAVKKFFETNIAPKLESIKESWDKIKKALSDAKDAFLNAIPPEFRKALEDVGKWIGEVVDKVKEWFKSVDWLKAIGDAFEWVGGIIVGILGGAVSGIISAVTTWIDGFIQSCAGVIEVISGIVEFCIALFTGGDIEAAWGKIWDGVVDYVSGLYKMVVGPIEEFVQGIIDWFVALWDELVGHSIVPDMIDAIVEWFLSLPGKIFKPLQDFVNGIIKKFKDMWSSIKSWWKSNVAKYFTKQYWETVFLVISMAAKVKLEELKSKISEKWTAIKSWFSSNVAPKLTLDYWKTKFDTIRKAIETKLDDAWEKVKDFFDVTEWKKKVVDAMDEIKKNFKIPSLPKIKLEVTYDTNIGGIKKTVADALGLAGWPRLSWSTYATGGFPKYGEMFIAREAGAEMVGSINGRTAVANNDQIVAAVSQGVYDAVRAAMGNQQSGGSGQNINVFLDGKQIYASIKKTESERGRSLMGNQLGYAY